MKRSSPPVILTIDDEKAIRESFRNYLEDYDYVVLEAENGRIGVELLKQQIPDLILADLRMPEMDGLEVLAYVKKNLPDTPILVISGTGVIGDVVEALHLGAWDYLLKPIEDLDVLLYSVEQSLERAWLIKQNRLYQEHLEDEVARRTQELKETNIALKESEERYRSLSEHSPIAILVHYKEKIEYINPEAIRLLKGEKKEDFIGMSVREFVRPEDIEMVSEIYRKLHERKDLAGVNESYFICRDGGVIPVEVSGNLINYNGNEAIQVVFRDISKRVFAEAVSKKQYERLNSLHQIEKAITSNDELSQTLELILDQLGRQLDIDASNILRFERPTNEMMLLATAGFKKPDPANYRFRIDRSHAAMSVLQKKVLTIDDIQNNSSGFFNVPKNWQHEGFVNYIGIPLIARGDVIGILELFTRFKVEQDQEWFKYMNTVSEQAAIAIDNAKILDDLRRSNLELSLAYDTTLEGWAKALELRDKETEGHSRRVTTFTLEMARRVGMDSEELVHVRRGAILHDIGKMGIPDNILLKEGPLNDEEWVIMRQHPDYANNLLSTIPYLKPALDIPYCHHEKWDGSGYPRGLKAEQIPISARIFAIIDVWDALSSDRPYRDAWPKEKVRKYIREESGKHFDPSLVKSFMEIIEEIM